VAESNIRFRVDSRDAVRQIREMAAASGRLGNSVLQTTTRLGGLQGILGRLAIVETTRRLVNQAATYQQLQTRVKLLTKSYGEHRKLLNFAASSAKKFGLSNRESLQSVTDLYGRLRPMNIALEDIQVAFTGFNTVAKLAGLSAAQAGGAFYQLSQALGSGRLQGDEFRSISEQVPGILQAIAKETGWATEDLKAFASQGKLTSEIMIKSLKRAMVEGAADIEALVKESDLQRIKDLQNAMEDLSLAIGGKLLPLFKPLITAVTTVVKGIGAMPDTLKAIVAGVLGLGTALVVLGPPLAFAVNQIIALQAALAAGTLMKALGAFAVLANPYTAAVIGITAAVVGLYTAWEIAKGKGNEFNKVIQTGTSEQIKNALAAKELRLEKLKLRIEEGKWVGNAKRGLKRLQEERAALEAQIKAAKGRLKDLEEGKLTKEEKKTQNLKKQKELWKEIGNIIRNDVAESVKGFIRGTKTLGEALLGILNRIADKFIDFAISGMFDALGSGGGFWGKLFGGGKASGGPVQGGTSYLVGEKGPELFTPGQSGDVIPNDALEAALARYAGGARGDAVLAGGGEVVGEGGSSGGGGGNINVTFASEVINDVSYVTYAQFEAGVQQAAAEGAKRGEQATLRRLQTSQSTRRRIGV